jgi:hypothetical protein
MHTYPITKGFKFLKRVLKTDLSSATLIYTLGRINFRSNEVPNNEGNTIIKVTMKIQKRSEPIIKCIPRSLRGTVRKQPAILF